MKLILLGIPSASRGAMPLYRKREMLKGLESEGLLSDVKQTGHYVWEAEATEEGVAKLEYLKEMLKSRFIDSRQLEGVGHE